MQFQHLERNGYWNKAPLMMCKSCGCMKMHCREVMWISDSNQGLYILYV